MTLNFRPRDTNYLVELLAPETKTAGGIFLPDSAQENWEDAIILRCGPGMFDETDTRSLGEALWCERGERIVFHQKDYRPFYTGSRQGVVADEAVICIIAGDEIYPANDWVLIEPAGFEESAGPIALPEELQSRPNCGVVLAWGPGTLQRAGALAGSRRPVMTTVRAPASELFEQRVWWTGPEDAYEVGSDWVRGVLVRAENLLFIEKE